MKINAKHKRECTKTSIFSDHKERLYLKSFGVEKWYFVGREIIDLRAAACFILICTIVHVLYCIEKISIYQFRCVDTIMALTNSFRYRLLMDWPFLSLKVSTSAHLDNGVLRMYSDACQNVFSKQNRRNSKHDILCIKTNLFQIDPL